MRLIANAEVINDGRRRTAVITVGDDGLIASVDPGHVDLRDIDPAAYAVIDAEGLWALPGVIDEHVHFRDPGMTERGDIATESRAALAGGVTTCFDMPNTRPATVTPEAWEAKMERAAAVSAVNYAFFPGVTDDNLDLLCAMDQSRIPGVKLFMGASTGGMYTDSADALARLFATYRGIIAVHAEDGRVIDCNRARLAAQYPAGIPVWMHRDVRDTRACVAATERAVRLAREHDARLHVMHISTADELRFFTPGDVAGKRITAETCPHYLIWGDISASDGPLANLTKCNPAIKGQGDRQALLRAIAEGLIDTVATDHAPHLREQKEGDALTAASGMPSVQFSLPLMLQLAKDGAFGPDGYESVVRLMCHAPADLWGIERRGYLRRGWHADITLVDPAATHVITDSDVVSRCGWTPYVGRRVDFAVAQTWVNGRPAFDRGRFTGDAHAAPVLFNH